MANSRATSQQTTNVSLNKSKLLQLAADEELGKKEYKILLCLFTQLEGYVPPKIYRTDSEDPRNFKKINIKAVMEATGLSKKDVKKGIALLEELIYLEPGDSDVTRNGYRFTF